MRDEKGRFVKGCKINKGRKHSKEWIEKTRKIKKEYYKTHSSWNKGKKGVMPVPWNKDKKGTYSLKHSGQFREGHIPWSKDKKLPQLSGENSSSWKDGKILHSGYFFIKKPTHPFCNHQGYVREHRLVIEKIIERYLKPTEKCHHLGKKDDNRPCMLMAFANHSAHMRFHGNPDNVKPEEIIFDGRKII